MRNQKSSTRRTLTLSIMAICLCCVMLVGATFAWFTDTATSGVNKIQSGNLDLKVEYNLTGKDTDWKALTKDTQLFKGGLFEPGYTRVVAFRVKNAGNLALKYAVNMNLVSETNGTNVYDKAFNLSDYLEVNTIADATADQLTAAFKNRTDSAALDWTTTAFNAALESLNVKDVVLKPDDASKVLLMQVTMPTDVGNEANAKDANSQPEINFGVAFVATQAVEESDSYGNTYDEKATYPVASASELKDALTEGGNVSLGKDVAVAPVVPDKTANTLVPQMEVTKDTNLDLSGQKLGVAADAEDFGKASPVLMTVTSGTLTIDGDGEINCEAGNQQVYGINVIGGKVVINGGSYYGAITAVQVQKGNLTINGGFFDMAPTCKVQVPHYAKYVVNCIDSAYQNGTAKIIVTGGTFVNFDPSANPEGAGTSYVADGYKVVSETQTNGDTWYTVVAE